MHVLIIPSWYPSEAGDASGSFFREQALALHRQGCRIGIIYPQLRSLRNWRSIAGGRYGREDEIDSGIPVLRSHGMNWLPLFRGGLSTLWLRKGLRLYADYKKMYGVPDVIHAHSTFNAGILAQSIAGRENIPFFLTEHSSIFLKNDLPKDKVDRARKVFSSAYKKFAVSENFAEALDVMSGKVKRWGVMPNIVDDIFSASERVKSREIRPFTFVCISALVKNKAIDNLVIAFSKAFPPGSDAILNIVGDGPERSVLEQMARLFGVSGRVNFIGALPRQRIPAELARGDVLVHPSRYETFGVVIIEALALGVPVVATRCGGPDSIVEDKDGLLVPVGDIAALVAAMREMTKNLDKYDPIEIRRSCLLRFGGAGVAQRLISEYAGALCDGHAG